jgi:hypothetical protein
MTTLSAVPPDAVPEVWPFVAELASTIAETSAGRVNADFIRERIETERMQLWVVLDDAGRALALAVTEIIAFPFAKVCVVHGLAGHDREKWIHHLGGIEAWARKIGCSRVEVRGRKGMAKVLREYKLTAVFLEKELCA